MIGKTYNDGEILYAKDLNDIVNGINELDDDIYLLNQTIDETKNEIDQKLLDIVVDPTYDPESNNAQSGKAVAEALEKSLFTFKEIDLEGTYTDFNINDEEAPSPSGIYEITDCWYSMGQYYIEIAPGYFYLYSVKEISGLSVGSKIYIEVEESDSIFRSVNKLAVQTADYVTREVFDNAIKNPILNYIDCAIVDNEVVITSCETIISGDHIIPETIDGYPVTNIGEAFVECVNLTSITIPGTVKTVGDYAFSDCFELISVIFSEGVTKLEGYPFEDCGNLRFVSIPESLTSIDEGAFADSSNITDIYYAGSKEQWDKITTSGWNANLTNATIHYNQAPAKKADVVVKYEELSNNDADNPLILKDNTEYTATETINNLIIQYPSNNFICSLYFTTASEGSITIVFPDTTKYIGGVPDFKPGETWELNIRNGVVVAGKVEEA